MEGLKILRKSTSYLNPLTHSYTKGLMQILIKDIYECVLG